VSDVLIRIEELDMLLERAAQRGADEALRKIGLHDERAIEEIAGARIIGRALSRVQDRVAAMLTNTISAAVIAIIVGGLYVFFNKFMK